MIYYILNMSFDEEYLLKALDNDSNQSIMELTRPQIKTTKNNILQNLQLSREDLKTMHTKLANYRYIDNINDLNYGSYVRWINIKNIKNTDDIYLNTGAFVNEIKVEDDNIIVNCHFKYIKKKFKFDECLVFQKLSDQEQVILDVMAHLKK
jgi:hypothetical protein